jgi:hypothetical protein
LLELTLRGHVDDRSDGAFEAALITLDEPPVHPNVPWLSGARHERRLEVYVSLASEGGHQYAQKIGLRFGGQQL